MKILNLKIFFILKITFFFIGCSLSKPLSKETNLQSENLVSLTEKNTPEKEKDNALCIEASEIEASEKIARPSVTSPYFGELFLPKAEFNLEETSDNSVILIVIDALNAKHLGIYGYWRNTSPNIDAVAKKALVFTNWSSTSSWTRPAFTSMITGLPKKIHKMELDNNYLQKKHTTIAEAFSDTGYNTAAFIGNPLVQARWNYNRGYDHFEDTTTLGDFPKSDQIVDSALSWLEKQKESKFFLTLFLTDPHAPYEPYPSARYFSKKSDPPFSPPREVLNLPEPSELQSIINAYDDEVKFTDSQVGRIVDWVQKNQKDTSLVITADHGEIFGEHNCFQHAYHMWEPVLRVPMIVSSPVLKELGVDETMANHEDLLSMLLYMHGIDRPKSISENIFSLTDDAIKISAYDARGIRRTAARTENWKLIRYEKINAYLFKRISGISSIDNYPSLLVPGPRYELFNLNNDPGEQTDLFEITKESEFVRQLQKAISKQYPVLKPKAKPKGTPGPTIDPQTLEALKAAGYIQ